MQKRLLQINVTANWGSTGRIAEDIGRTAIENGWESWIAYGRNNNPSSSNLIRIGSDYDVKRHALLSRVFDNQGLASKQATRQYIKRIEELSPDIIHLHNIHGYYLNYELLFDFLRNWGGPVVWTLHDIWPITGHCAYFGVEECQKWLTGCGNCKRLNTYPQSLFIDRSADNYKQKRKAFSSLKNLTLIPVSDWLSGLIGQSFLSNYPRITIHNGVDTNIFSPGEKAASPYIIGVANVWEERKGLQDFFKLREILPKEILVKLVGLTESQIKSLPEGIVGIERTNSVKELAELYSSALALVNPTYEDNFPTVNIEAISCGIPVITYDTGGSPEVIDSQTSYVVEKGEYIGLADAIKKIYSSNLNDLKDRCRKRALQLFAKDKCYTKYIEEYNKLIDVRGYLVCVASVWNKEKGFDDILRLRQLMPKQELIVMIGLTPAQKESLPEGIIGIERTSNVKQLAMLYSGADAFINPTWGDNFPTVNIEALACATPVITYKTGGSPEAVDAHCGIVVNQGDISALMNAVFKIKENVQFYSPMRCRFRAIDRFDKVTQFKEYINLYDKCLSTH